MKYSIMYTPYPELYLKKTFCHALFICGYEPRSGQTKGYKIGICCFSTKHATLRRKSKDWLARNQDNVSEWGDMSIHRLVSVG